MTLDIHIGHWWELALWVFVARFSYDVAAGTMRWLHDAPLRLRLWLLEQRTLREYQRRRTRTRTT